MDEDEISLNDLLEVLIGARWLIGSITAVFLFFGIAYALIATPIYQADALLRRLVKGAELPAIHPLVDVNNCLSAELAVPCCVMREDSFGSHLVFRAGVAGESYESLRGVFNLEAKPLLVDEIGPVDAPITGSTRVMVEPSTTRVWLVAYLPQGIVAADDAWTVLEALSRDVGVEAERSATSVVVSQSCDKNS